MLDPLAPWGGFLISIFFFLFFTKIYFRYGNLQKYTPAAQLPGGRDLAARQQGLFRKKNTKNNCRQIPRTGRPAAGRPVPPAARLPGGRPPSHMSTYIKVLAAPHSPFGLLKIKNKRKEREG